MIKTENIQDGAVTTPKIQDGTITSAKVVGGLLGMPRVMSGRLYGCAIPNTTPTLDFNFLLAATPVVGTPTLVFNATGSPINNFASGILILDQAGINPAAMTLLFSGRKNIKLSSPFQLTELVDRRCYIGFFSATPMADDTPGLLAINGIGLRVSSTGASTNFVAVACNGVADTVMQFPVPVPADILEHTVTIETTDGGLHYTITLDAQSVVIAAANLPAVNVQLGYVQTVLLTFAGVAKNIRFRSEVEMDE